MIGLKKGTVKLAVFDDSYKNKFEELFKDISSILISYSVSIEHFGSSTIPNFIGKPIVDIVVGVHNEHEVNDIVTILGTSNYVFIGKHKKAKVFLFSLQEGGKTISIIHVLRHNSYAWKKYIAIRDYLIFSCDARSRYLEVKIYLQEKYKDDRASYTNKKRRFIVFLAREAFAWKKIVGETNGKIIKGQSFRK